MNELTKEWVDKGEEDFHSADLLLHRDLEHLNRYAVVVRYPGVIIKARTAEEALIAADRVRRFVKRKLKIR